MFKYVLLLMLMTTMIHNSYAETVTVVDNSWQARQAKMRQQGEAEIQRRHELELQRIKAEVLALKLQLEAGNVNVYSSSYSAAGVISKTTNENTVRSTNTQTNENN